MKKVPFYKARFITSALLKEDWPHLGLPEIAIVGRSNAGKSSLINHLLKHHGLARVSATPGKTQTLNFFVIDEVLTLVDLPGYGYSKVPKGVKINWSESLDLYLRERDPIDLILLLLDIRHPPSKEDLAFIEWSHYHRRALLLVFTKCDKVKDSERELLTKKALALVGPLSYVHYSIKDAKGRERLIATINRVLYGTD